MTFRTRETTRRAFTFAESANMFGVSKDSLKRAAKRGDLRTIMVGGRRLVPASECDRIEKEGLGFGRNRRAHQENPGLAEARA
jgi:excisionase family DNA binding protein